MIAEDARWAADFLLSSQRRPKSSPFLALILGHHFVRIVYEGGVTLRSEDPYVGIPQLADLLEDTFAAVTERGRHVTKLLDDNKKSYEAVLAELDRVIKEHRATFSGNAIRWARWLESDLGLYVADGRLLGASWPAAYRLGLSVEADGTIAGHDLRAVTEEWGGTLAILSGAALDAAEPTATLDLGGMPSIIGKDRRSDRYLRRRFEDTFPDALKMLLLTIEGEMNTLMMVARHSERGHEASVFRARTVALYHSLTALTRIAKRYESLTSKGMRELNGVLTDSAVRTVLSKPGKMVRNRCVHYEIRDSRVSINPSLPMFGIVESVFPGESWHSFNLKVNLAIERVAQHLSNWAPT